MHEKYEQRHTLNSVVVANPNCSYAVGVIRQAGPQLPVVWCLESPVARKKKEGASICENKLFFCPVGVNRNLSLLDIWFLLLSRGLKQLR